MSYNAAGQVASDTLGDGEIETYTYDTRLRLQAESAVYGSTPIYSYSLTFAPNENVLTANDSVNGNWNYSYDQFNRLVCASLSSNTACAMPPTGTAGGPDLNGGRCVGGGCPRFSFFLNLGLGVVRLLFPLSRALKNGLAHCGSIRISPSFPW